MRPGNGLRRAAVAVILIAAGSLRADDENLPIAPDDLVFCTVCHGVQLMGNDALRAPRLSGMEAWYVENQLRAFSRGWRGRHAEDLVGMEMRPMAAGLSDDQVVRAAEFVSRTISPPPEHSVEGDAQNGKRLYAPCAACHGVDGAGNEALGAPALAGQNDWYMIHQLNNYSAGKRGYDPDDTLGQQMRASVRLLDDDEAVRDVVLYITTLNNQ